MYDEEGTIYKPDIAEFGSCNGSLVSWGYWGKALIRIPCLACKGQGIVPYVGHAPFGNLNHV